MAISLRNHAPRTTRYATTPGATTMTGTHYTLDRDKDENKNPMDVVKEKACLRCGTVKPNTFKFFGKKLWQTRVGLTTTDICCQCQKERTSASMKAKWAERKQKNAGYQEERLRMARAQYEAQELARAQAEAYTLAQQAKAEEVKPLDMDDGDIKPISLEQAMDFKGSGGAAVSRGPEHMIREELAPVRVETESEKLMRELLGGS